jgi:TolB-like protein/tetratricopeptide (TPR) repeat protein
MSWGCDKLESILVPVDPVAVRRQVAKILRTADFVSNPRLSAFLRHVVGKALEGRTEEIKEQTVAIEVFGRQPSFDPRTDSIVRTEARRLREKLAYYYLNTGKDDRIVIEVPKGTYVPLMRAVELVAAPALGRTEARRYRAPWILIAAAATCVVFAIATVASKRWPGSGAGAAKRTIAVLPFANLDPHTQSAYLSEGVTEDLERDFSRVPGLEVHARPPADARGDLDYPRLAAKLHVDYLIDGAVERTGNNATMHAVLVRGSNGSIVWTDHFVLGDSPLAAERKIEAGTATALGTPVPTLLARAEDPKAHDLYLQGRNLWAKRDRKATEQAIALFQHALAIDPNYALAWMGIADAYALMTFHGFFPVQEGLKRGEAAATRAVALDPSLAEAHAALGLLKMAQWDWKAADAEYERAIALNPSYDRAYERAGIVRFYLGDFAGGERLMRQSETLNPWSPALPMIRAEVYFYARRYADALDLCHKVQSIDPKDPTAPGLEARVLLQLGQPENALRTQLTAPAPAPPFALGSLLYAAGRRDEGLQMLMGAIRDRERNYVDAYHLAISFAQIKDRERTLEWLEKALAERSPDLPSLRAEPPMDFVREDPRFKAVFRKVFERS